MDRISSSTSSMLRVLVGVLLTLSNLFLLIAISTNYWVTFYRIGELVHVGIWNVCFRQICESHTGTIQSKVILIFFVILNLLTNAFVIFTLWTGERDSKRMIGKTCIFNGCLGCLGMVFASIFFLLDSNVTVLYGFPLGWLSVILVIACGVISLVHACQEPDQSTNVIQNYLHGQHGNDIQPPYTTQTPPAAVIVS